MCDDAVPLGHFVEPVPPVPTTFEELFGVALAHLWDSYVGDVMIDSIAGLNGTPTGTAPAQGTVNGHTYPVFNGTDSVVEAADMPTLDGLSSWTFFWAAKTANPSTLGAIIDHAFQFYVELDGSPLSFAAFGYASGDAAGTTDVTDDVWHRGIWTVTAGAGKMYVDGVLQGTGTFPAMPAASAPTSLGTRPAFGPDEVFDGGIAIIGVATRGVTADEVVYLDDLISSWITP